MTLLASPNDDELREHLPPPVVPKILRHLDPATGSAEHGEPQCVRVAEVIYSPWSIRVNYVTHRPDGKTGSQFMNFFPWSAVMRCLAVTTDRRVVLLQEHRRNRGAWVDGMHIAGGVKDGNLVDAVRDEMFAESGCKLTDRSRILSLGAWYMDDGVFADPLPLLAVDQVHAPDSHANPEESIRGIRLMPWDEWRSAGRGGTLADVYANIFGDRCYLDDRTGSVLVHGCYQILHAPATSA